MLIIESLNLANQFHIFLTANKRAPANLGNNNLIATNITTILFTNPLNHHGLTPFCHLNEYKKNGKMELWTVFKLFSLFF